MIYTVTFNPAVDYVVHASQFEPGKVNRSESEEYFFGGKGINVSAVLQALGVPSTALGFLAGFTGDIIEKSLKNEGVQTDFIWLEKGFSRINLKIRSDLETELNGRGPEIGADALEELFCKLNALQEGDTLVLAGSIPSTLPEDIYEKILAGVQNKSVRTVVDATGNLLKNVLKYKPFLIKPNHHELGKLFGVTLKSQEEVIEYAAKLQRMGAQNVLVSMAEKGAALLDVQGNRYFCPACKGEVKNSVGAGDSMVAGFLAGIQQGDFAYALKLGTAAGGATAFSEGLARKEDILALLRTID